MTNLILPQSDVVADTFDFSVDKFPLSGPDGLRTDHYGLFRSDTSECVGRAVKKGYIPHTVDDVQVLKEAALKVMGQDAKVEAYWHKGHVVTVQPGLAFQKDIGLGDNIVPRMMVYAGYGGAAYRYTLGLYRFLCLNFEMVAMDDLAISANIRHTAGLRPKIKSLVNQVDHLVSNWDSLADGLRAMNEREVNMAEFLAEVYPQREGTETQAAKDKRRIEAIFTRLMRERDKLNSHNRFGKGIASAWEMFNAVQGYTQHDMTRKGQPSKALRAHLALEDKSVSKAMQLAIAA